MWHKVSSVSEMTEKNAVVVRVETYDIALIRTKKGIFAIDNVCPHMGGPLVEGHAEKHTVICPWHAWEFDLKTGDCKTYPGFKQKTFPVKTEGQEVWIDI